MIPAFVQRACVAVAICAAAAAAVGDPPPPTRSDAAIVLEIQRLLSPDHTITDPDQQRQAMLAGLREVPALIRTLESRYPESRYRPVAYALAIDALLLRSQAGDETATAGQLALMARRLLGVTDDDELRGKARFVLLDCEIMALLVAASRPTTLASQPASAAALSARARGLAAMARKFTCLADDLPRTSYAPAALFQAGGLYLQAEREPSALASFRRLGQDYPKDPFTLKGMMILVQLHTRAGRMDEALAVKRRVVENFSGSAAAIKYRADIAKAECVGRPFFLRFRSVRGQAVNVRDHRGKTVLVYFYASLVEPDLAERVAGEMSALARLADERGCVLLAVGADREADKDKVAAALKAGNIKTPNLLDPDSQVARNYGVLFVPAVAIVGADGKLKDIVSDAEILAAVKKALRAGGGQAARRPAPG